MDDASLRRMSQLERRINALECTVAWLITKDEQNKFFTDCKGLIERDRPEENQEFIEGLDFSGISDYMEFLVRTKLDPDVPPPYDLDDLKRT